jgi:hypothetical protein
MHCGPSKTKALVFTTPFPDLRSGTVVELKTVARSWKLLLRVETVAESPNRYCHKTRH